MDTIEQLRIKCGKKMTPEQRKQRPWFTEKVTRRFSIYLTWLFIRFGITANQVSLSVLILGIISGGAFIWGHFFVGVLFLQIWYLLDAVDGEIARYHRANDLTGDYSDKLMHYVIEAWIFYTLGVGMAREYDSFWFQHLGLWVACFFTLLKLIYDLKYRCMMLYILNTRDEVVFRKSERIATHSPRSIWIQRVLKTYSLYPNVMNIITSAVLIDSFFEGFAWIGVKWTFLSVLLISYGVFYFAACCKGCYSILRQREVDKELHRVIVSHHPAVSKEQGV